MGIFFDTCDALIDPQTGRALTGEALANAQQDPKWPRCGNRVSKRARFCNSCGKPAPGGWWKCPGCGKWIGNDSRFCPHCNQPLYPDDRAAMAGGVWRKEPEHFAQRFEVGDIKRELTHDLQVQEGTVAVLMDAGGVSGVLEAGAHNVDSLAHRVNWFGNPPPRSVVLVDVGEVVMPLHIEGLRTAEHFPIEFYGEVMLRFRGDKDAARAFMANILGSNRACTFKEVADHFAGSARIAVDEMCVSSTVDDLVRDPERRIRLQERMTSRLEKDLAASGLELVRVSSAEFTGDEYEKYADNLGKVEEERLALEYRAAIRKLASDEDMAKYRDADSLRNYKETIDHEYRVSHETRDREFELLKREWEHDDIKYRRLIELEEQDHAHVLDGKEHAHAVEMNLLDANGRLDVVKVQAAIDRIANDEKIDEEKKWLEVRRLKMLLEQENKRLDAERRQSMTIEQMLADILDPEQRADMLKLYQMKLQSGMTPQQILASMGKTDHNDEFLQKMEELYKDNAGRIDKNLSKMLEPATEAAKHPTTLAGPFVK